MIINDEFGELEKQLRATTEPIESLRVVEKSQLRPSYSSTPFPWQRVAAPLGFCAVSLMVLLAYFVISSSTIIDTPREAASEIVPTNAALATEPAEPTVSGLAAEPAEPTRSAETVVTEDDAVAFVLERARAIDPVEFGDLELLSAELITPVELAFDSRQPDPTLPEQFWAVTFIRTATHITENCTVLTKERFEFEHTRFLSLSCSERLPFDQFTDDFVHTSAPKLIALPDTTITASRAEIRSINVLPLERDGFSQVEVIVPYEQASRDGRVVLHWGYFYQTVSNSGMEEANTGDIVVQPGRSRGVAVFRFEVSDLLITNGTATNLFLSTVLRPANSDTLAGKRIVYVVPKDLREYEGAISAEAFAKLGVNMQTINLWQEVRPLHEDDPIDILLIHHVFVQFRPQPTVGLVDQETIQQLLDDGVAIVGVGVDHHSILSAGEFGRGGFGARLNYSLLIKSDTQSVRELESLLLSSGWSQLIEDLERYFDNP